MRMSLGIHGVTLDHDQRVELTAPSGDLDVLKGCIGQSASGACSEADLDGDGQVDAADEQRFAEAKKFAFSGDGVIDSADQQAFEDAGRFDLTEDGVVDLRTGG